MAKKIDAAMKRDDGKVPLDLVPSFPIYAVAKVLEFGTRKYARNNWRMGDPPEWSRVYASIQRHLTAWWDGEEIDPESGLSHLWHAGCQVLMLIYYAHYNKKQDNRFRRKP